MPQQLAKTTNSHAGLSGVSRGALGRSTSNEALVLRTNHYSASFAGDGTYLASNATTLTITFF